MMRKFIDIVNEAILYRGDSTEIDKFSSEHSSPHNLFGAGIYLTDNPEVANDYTLGNKDELLTPKGHSSEREAVAAYIASLINGELDWAIIRSEIKDRHAERLGEFEFTDTNRDKYVLHRKKVETEMRDEMEEKYAELAKEAKKIYRKEKDTIRAISTTEGEWFLTRTGRGGTITHFEIPDAYLAKCLYTSGPMTDKQLQEVRAYIGESKVWFRDHEGEVVSDVDDPFEEWLAGYRANGARRAWVGGLAGGDGSNPSLEHIVLEQHAGSFFSGDWKKFTNYLEGLGYVGFSFNAGVADAGGHTRGGGGKPHVSYVLWDDDFVNKCQSDRSAVSDAEVNRSRIYSKTLFRTHGG